jgi:hypothetical protein
MHSVRRPTLRPGETPTELVHCDAAAEEQEVLGGDEGPHSFFLSFPVYAKVTGSPYVLSENVNLYYVYGG